MQVFTFPHKHAKFSTRCGNFVLQISGQPIIFYFYFFIVALLFPNLNERTHSDSNALHTKAPALILTLLCIFLSISPLVDGSVYSVDKESPALYLSSLHVVSLSCVYLYVYNLPHLSMFFCFTALYEGQGDLVTFVLCQK